MSAFLCVGLRAAARLYERLLRAVLGTDVEFFDRNPVGHLSMQVLLLAVLFNLVSLSLLGILTLSFPFASSWAVS